MGAVCYKPDDVIILPDIMPNGVKGGHGTAGDELIKLDDESAKEFAALIGSGGGAVDVCDLKKEVTDASGNKKLLFPFQDQIEGALVGYGYPRTEGDHHQPAGTLPLPTRIYAGRVDSQDSTTLKWTTIQHNNGHLETLDGWCFLCNCRREAVFNGRLFLQTRTTTVSTACTDTTQTFACSTAATRRLYMCCNTLFLYPSHWRWNSQHPHHKGQNLGC